jgi:hypothetical protein
MIDGPQRQDARSDQGYCYLRVYQLLVTIKFL